ncbi:MAG: hypothetical protein WD024_08795 [Bacillota bacterium]
MPELKGEASSSGEIEGPGQGASRQSLAYVKRAIIKNLFET